MAGKKKLTKQLDNGFSDVTVAAEDRHSDDAETRAAGEAAHGQEMAFRATAATEGGGPFPRELLYQRLLPKTRWPE